MPLTPFHLGPALLVAVLLYRRVDLPTALLGSVVVDVRAALVVFGYLDGPVHGVLTTFLGGGAVALLVAVGVYALPPSAESVLAWTRLAETGDRSSVAAGALVGVLSHVVLDSVLYADADPLYPLDANPLLVGREAVVPVYAGCVAAAVAGLVLFAVIYSADDAV
ncbi:MAG: hypothetical protein ABEJ40_07715 [Haloarculaceae archaeon]